MKRLWKVGLGANGEFEAEAIDRNLLIIGFGITTDVSHAIDRDAFVAIMESVFPGDNPKKHLNFAAQLNQFVNTIKVGDLVVSPMKTTGTFWIGEVTGPYAPHSVTGQPTRPVHWLRTALPRETIKQDLRYSFGAFMTVCEITRNNPLSRIEKVVQTGSDPGGGTVPKLATPAGNGAPATSETVAEEAMVDLDQLARDQIEARIASVFTGHDLTRLVAAVLEAQGKRVRVSPPGADNGVDIVAGSGALGLESPRLVVQVKSGSQTVDQPTLQSLIGTVQDTKADYGLMVSWGGFTQPVLKRTNELFFRVRLWGRQDIIDNLFSVYDRLPEAIRAELPLRRTWTLVPDDGEDA